MALFAMILSGIFGAISNLCLRKNMEEKGSVQAFFFLQLLLTGVVVFFLFPVRKGIYYGHPLIFAIAIVAGFVLKWMKTFVGRALQHGPPGMSFAVLNCASLFPILVLYLAFSANLFIMYTSSHLIGSILIAIGLFWGGWELSAKQYQKKEWIFWIFCAFLLHLVYLLLKEWRCLLFQGNFREENFFFFCGEHLDTLWFAPLIFLSSSLFHGFFFFRTEKRWLTKTEWQWGVVGGLWNGLCSFFFTLGPEMQKPYEAAFLFPTFAITLIFACNLWGQRFYKERIYWWASAVCFVGLIVGAAGPWLLEQSEKQQVHIVQNENRETPTL